SDRARPGGEVDLALELTLERRDETVEPEGQRPGLLIALDVANVEHASQPANRLWEVRVVIEQAVQRHAVDLPPLLELPHGEPPLCLGLLRHLGCAPLSSLTKKTSFTAHASTFRRLQHSRWSLAGLPLFALR